LCPSAAAAAASRRAQPPEDPILTIARNTAASVDVLRLNELLVTDVTDAMLLLLLLLTLPI
jgi:predicted ATPase